MKVPARHRRGFTLIEVLVALVIVALGVAAVMTALVSAGAGTSRLRERTLAEWVAADRITETRLANEFPTLGRSEGEALQAGLRWRWQQVVERTAVDGVVAIVVSVRSVDAPGSDWQVTLRGARGRDIAHRGDMDGGWDTASGDTP